MLPAKLLSCLESRPRRGTLLPARARSESIGANRRRCFNAALANRDQLEAWVYLASALRQRAASELTPMPSSRQANPNPNPNPNPASLRPCQALDRLTLTLTQRAYAHAKLSTG